MKNLKNVKILKMKGKIYQKFCKRCCAKYKTSRKMSEKCWNCRVDDLMLRIENMDIEIIYHFFMKFNNYRGKKLSSINVGEGFDTKNS